ncbi:MAG: S8 family serine peptidase [Mojavia pulchra JT2-VF2]|jgi:subtilisin family serine protease|uniref:S8 family serine peptidase n=1 Tax=Mojavia pulchra JT2-VF2 TaxID=287848 RepID=A0A951UEL2_9NOST|nr:S8 family serine peptidase [Mojavia pulchra JT2-VF2]
MKKFISSLKNYLKTKIVQLGELVSLENEYLLNDSGKRLLSKVSQDLQIATPEPDVTQNNQDEQITPNLVRNITELSSISIYASSSGKRDERISSTQKKHYIQTTENNGIVLLDSISDDIKTNALETGGNNDVTSPDWIPNEPSFSSLWGLNKINAPTAWNYTRGSNNVVVAVVDTGVDYNHSDLAANIWRNKREIAGNAIDDDGNGYIDDVHGWDFGDWDNDPRDDHSKGGHGTHIAGILGAVGNNSLGVVGVSPNVSIMTTKHFKSTDPEGYLWDTAQGIKYAVDNGAKIINLSFGSKTFDTDQYNAIKYAYDRGVLVIATAGNTSRNIDEIPHYPASYDLDNIISVTATDENDQLVDFSNYGVNSVDLAAPGVNILSTFPNNQYVTWGGTSMAVPHVTGAAALLLSMNPNLSVLELKSALLSSVDQINSLQGKTKTGGRLNLSQLYPQRLGKNLAEPGNLNNSSVDVPVAQTIRIEAENYKTAYDNSPDNDGGQYRIGLNVDVEATSDVGGGYNVGWIQPGEWLTYDVNIPKNGFYDILVRVAAWGSSNPKQLKALINNEQERIISFNPTGGYQSWTNAIAKGLSLSAGSHELRLDMLTASFNINYIDLIPTNATSGDSNNATISSDTQNNLISGGPGNDILIGGDGNSILTGGDGADIFAFNYISEGIDTISDFLHEAGDKIQIGSGFGATDLSQFNYDSLTGALSFNTTQFASLNINSGFDQFSDIIFV